MAFGFDDLKDHLNSAWEQFQESALYQQARDRYENLSPLLQKLVLFGMIGIVLLLFASLPWNSFSNSSDSVVAFEEKRNLVRDLLKVSRDANDNPDIPIPPDLNGIKMGIEMNLQQAQLLPTQMQGVQIITESSTLIPSSMALGMLKVSLSQLNLRQIVDLGYQIQNFNPSVKMLDMEMTANPSKPKYFDVVFKLMALNVPQLPPPNEADDSTKKSNSRSKGNGSNKDSDSAETN